MDSDWESLTLKQAGISLIDCDHRTPTEAAKGLPYVAIPQLRDGRILISEARKISEADFNEWTRKANPKAHDVVLSRRCNPGESAYVPAGIRFALGQNLVLLRSDATRVHPAFLRWLVKGPEWWRQVDAYINVGAIFTSLKCADIPKFQLTIPPMDKQLCISASLSSIDDKITLNRQINQTLEAMAQAIFKSWFVDFDPVKAKIAAIEAGQDPLRAAMSVISSKSDAELDALPRPQYEELAATAALFPEELVESELGDVPKGWEVVSLHETAEYLNGAAFKASDFSDVPESLPIIKIAELKQGVSSGTKRTLKGINTKYQIESGDVLYSWSGSPDTSLDVFRWFGVTGVLNQHIFKLSFSCEGQREYTYYLLKEIKPILVATAKQKQTTGLGHITVADMKRIKVVRPRLSELHRFTQQISEVYATTANYEQQAITLAALRDTLLPKLLSGELSVSSLSDLTESMAGI